MLRAWGVFVDVSLAVKAYRIQYVFPNFNVKHHTGQSQLFLLVPLLYTPIPHSKGIWKTLFQNVAFKAGSKPRESSFVKRKAQLQVFTSLLLHITQFKIKRRCCYERPSGIFSRLNATLWHEAFDRTITPPCLCRPLKNRLWSKADISLTYRSSAAVVNELQLVQLCPSVGLRIIGSLTKRTEAELGSRNITESVGKAIWRKDMETSPLIDSWESMTIAADLYVLTEERPL